MEPMGMEKCVLGIFQSGHDGMTLGEVRSQCQKKEQLVPYSVKTSIKNKKMEETFDNKNLPISARHLSGSAWLVSEGLEETDIPPAVEKRLSTDEENILKPFTIMSHKPNYIFGAAYNSEGYSAEHHEELSGGRSIEFDDVEVQFQISVKTPLGIGLFNSNIDVYAAYTNRSFWQLYNKDISSPFRETNHEPEGWLQVRSNWQIFGFSNKVNMLGIVHQSNGMAGGVSRSWNRIYAKFIFERDNFAFSINPWYRLQEDADKDDNRDISDYMGHAEFGFAYKWRGNTFNLMLRNNIESDFKRGAVRVGWSFPLFKYPYLKGYIQYFHGYGESLLDYDRRVNTLGLGVLLTDWL